MEEVSWASWTTWGVWGSVCRAALGRPVVSRVDRADPTWVLKGATYPDVLSVRPYDRTREVWAVIRPVGAWLSFCPRGPWTDKRGPRGVVSTDTSGWSGDPTWTSAVRLFSCPTLRGPSFGTPDTPRRRVDGGHGSRQGPHESRGGGTGHYREVKSSIR